MLTMHTGEIDTQFGIRLQEYWSLGTFSTIVFIQDEKTSVNKSFV